MHGEEASTCCALECAVPVPLVYFHSMSSGTDVIHEQSNERSFLLEMIATWWS